MNSDITANRNIQKNTATPTLDREQVDNELLLKIGKVSRRIMCLKQYAGSNNRKPNVVQQNLKASLPSLK